MRSRRQVLVGLGAALLLPRAAFAQKPARVWRIGVLASRRGPGSTEWDRYYSQVPLRLKELGYLEGTNLEITWRFAAGDYARLPEYAAELVSLKADVIVTEGSQGIRAAQEATSTIPIVFNGGTNVVGSGFVKSLSRPGGNTTGVTLLLSDSIGKQVELLTRVVPKLSRVAVMTNPSNPADSAALKIFQEAAEATGGRVLHVEARTPKEIEAAFAHATREHAGAIAWTSDSFFLQQQKQIAEYAAASRLPSISGTLEYPTVGGLMGYGPDRGMLWRRVADYVDKIFKGANPGDLPVEQPTKLDLVINRRTAKALGLEIPADLLVQADKVID